MVRNKEAGSFIEYKGLKIFEKDSVFTVGGAENASFEDCTLENLGRGPDEFEMVQYCRENGIPVQFDDLRGHVDDLPYEKYLEHLGKYNLDPDGAFTADEFIVPVVRCVSAEQVLQFIDWIEEMEQGLFVVAAEPARTVDSIVNNAQERVGAYENGYCASIIDAESGRYLVEEGNGNIVFGGAEDRLLFYEEADAESTLAYLNDATEYCCVLLDERGERAMARDNADDFGKE